MFLSGMATLTPSTTLLMAAFAALELLIAVYCLFFSRENFSYVILALCFAGVKAILLLLPVLILIPALVEIATKGKAIISKAAFFGLFILFYTFCVTMVMSVYSFNPYAIVLWLITYGSAVLALFSFSSQEISHQEQEKLLHFFLQISVVQLVIGIFQIIAFRQFDFGDLVKGTMLLSKEYGMVIFMLFLYVVMPQLMIVFGRKEPRKRGTTFPDFGENGATDWCDIAISRNPLYH